MNRTEYLKIRDRLVAEPHKILAMERHYSESLVQIVLNSADSIYRDFDVANQTIPFWKAYAPKQRGRGPTAMASPWSEVGEKSISSNLLVSIAQTYPSVAFPGLPFGGDVRFATNDALVHLDIKMTGPNDNANEIVVPPQQISGDGSLWSKADGMQNHTFQVKGQRASMNFQPKLPPYYVMNGNIRLCLTYFLKGVYEVEGFGVQPLRHLEIACVPNGLLLFDGPKLAQTRGLFIPGKDDKSKAEHDKRTRIRLDPLASLGKWRCTKISKEQDVWKTDFR